MNNKILMENKYQDAGKKERLPVAKKRKLPVPAVILIVLAAGGFALLVGYLNGPTTIPRHPVKPSISPAQKFSGHGIAFNLPEGFDRLEDRDTPAGPMLGWNWSKSRFNPNYSLLACKNPGLSGDAFLDITYEGFKAGLKADRILEETQEQFTVAKKSRNVKRLVCTKKGNDRVSWFLLLNEKDTFYLLTFFGSKSEEPLLRKTMTSILATIEFSPR